MNPIDYSNRFYEKMLQLFDFGNMDNGLHNMDNGLQSNMDNGFEKTPIKRKSVPITEQSLNNMNENDIHNPLLNELNNNNNNNNKINEKNIILNKKEIKNETNLNIKGNYHSISLKDETVDESSVSVPVLQSQNQQTSKQTQQINQIKLNETIKNENEFNDFNDL